MNAGCLRPIRIVIPEGSMLSPAYPRAVVAGNVETVAARHQRHLRRAGALANSQGTMNNLTFGNAKYQYYETICSGSPAAMNSGRGFNGTSGVHTHMTNSRLTDPEILEMRFPVELEDFHIREDSGGKGKFRPAMARREPSAFSSAWTSRSCPRTATARHWASMAAAKAKSARPKVAAAKACDQTVLDAGEAACD
jgi:5-oxoprolinase (ATP-hydrolysing)